MRFKGQKVEFDDLHKNHDNDDDGNHNPYVDYENRPIKPLDKNMFFKQLSEFSELSSEELEKMKEKYV